MLVVHIAHKIHAHCFTLIALGFVVLVMMARAHGCCCSWRMPAPSSRARDRPCSRLTLIMPTAHAHVKSSSRSWPMLTTNANGPCPRLVLKAHAHSCATSRAPLPWLPPLQRPLLPRQKCFRQHFAAFRSFTCLPSQVHFARKSFPKNKCARSAVKFCR